MLHVIKIEERMGARVFAGQLQGCELMVGRAVEVRRDDEALGNGVVFAVLVGGKLLDQAKSGQHIELTIRGPADQIVQVGDMLHFG